MIENDDISALDLADNVKPKSDRNSELGDISKVAA